MAFKMLKGRDAGLPENGPKPPVLPFSRGHVFSQNGKRAIELHKDYAGIRRGLRGDQADRFSRHQTF
jgi:hypothetical protein